MVSHAAEPAGRSDGPNLPVQTVAELSAALKRTVEDRFGLVRVRGEVSGLKRPGSGHVYFALKDAEAKLEAVCFRQLAAKLRFQPQDGLEVIATGRLTIYPGRSQYQLVVERLEPAGIGALMALLDERRRKLAAEGLFEAARKRPLPYLPEVIAVVTSPTGAVIRDILHRLADRLPRRVLVWPVLVQGEGAPEQIAAAIAGLNRLPAASLPRPDLIIVARGGGSIEDLWAFNEEIVVRAAAASAIPLIAAVGHETDTTLIDFVADWCAPTPTAAAERAVPVRAELLQDLGQRGLRLEGALARLLGERRQRLAGLARGLGRPRDRLDFAQQRLDDVGERAGRALAAALRARADRLSVLASRLSPRLLAAELERRRLALAGLAGRLNPRLALREVTREMSALARLGDRLGASARRQVAEAATRLTGLGKLLQSLSYEGVLERGFAVVRKAGGTIVERASAINPGEQLAVQFHDGTVTATADGGTVVPRPRPRRPAPSSQGSLL
ncbi:MAG: exodeoxyribonuclease VII large subunit [Alphaproteobacteria bacterium]|nr:exodeoxyribonuclease VII large subunit [Alphaproteobacteria bacterium]